MDWTVRGMDEATRRRAEAAAEAAGLSLSAWLDRAILANADSFVPPPAWLTGGGEADGDAPDPLADPAAQAAIQEALDALEARLDARAAQVADMVTPLSQKLDHMAGQSEPARPPLMPSRAYRRGLGLIAAALLLLSIGGAGGLVWLWFEMQEPPPNPYAEMDPSQWRQSLSPAARAAMEAPGVATTAATAPLPATPGATTPSGAPSEYADLEQLIAQSRAGTLAAADPAPVEPAGALEAAVVSVQPAQAQAAQAPAAARTPATNPAATTPPVAPSSAASPRAGGDAQLVAQLRAAAAKNDAKAQHDLGLLMMEGRIVPRDEKGAAELFEKAAVQGLANAQYNLGVIYDNGLGRPADQTMAYFWYSAAADQGHIAAQYNLGVAAAQGKGAPRDYAVAALWFERAAKGGLPDAQYNLGQLYESGLGVPQELETAYDLYSAAAAQGYSPARQRMIGLESRIAARPPMASVVPVVPQRGPPPPAAAEQPAAPPGAAGLARKDIVEIQTLLRKLALLQGSADGNLGPMTRNAIRQYQTMAGLKSDGEPSLDLLQELREVAAMN